MLISTGHRMAMAIQMPQAFRAGKSGQWLDLGTWILKNADDKRAQWAGMLRGWVMERIKSEMAAATEESKRRDIMSTIINATDPQIQIRVKSFLHKRLVPKHLPSSLLELIPPQQLFQQRCGTYLETGLRTTDSSQKSGHDSRRCKISVRDQRSIAARIFAPVLMKLCGYLPP